MKKHWTCSAAELELTLAPCFLTIYVISSKLLLRTHFKPPSSVCNNFLLRSHVEFGRLLLLKYAIYSLFMAVQISISEAYTFIIMKIWKYQENHLQ